MTSTDDAISATTDVTVKDTTLTITAGGGQANATVEEQAPPGQESTADSSTPSPKGINAGVSYTQDSGTVTVNVADEGLQAPFINVAGGELSIAAGDDGGEHDDDGPDHGAAVGGQAAHDAAPSGRDRRELGPQRVLVLVIDQHQEHAVDVVERIGHE